MFYPPLFPFVVLPLIRCRFLVFLPQVAFHTLFFFPFHFSCGIKEVVAFRNMAVFAVLFVFSFLLLPLSHSVLGFLLPQLRSDFRNSLMESSSIQLSSLFPSCSKWDVFFDLSCDRLAFDPQKSTFFFFHSNLCPPVSGNALSGQP